MDKIVGKPMALAPEYFECRDCGESFSRQRDSITCTPFPVFRQAARCPKCGSEKVETTTKATARKVVKWLFD